MAGGTRRVQHLLSQIRDASLLQSEARGALLTFHVEEDGFTLSILLPPYCFRLFESYFLVA